MLAFLAGIAVAWPGDGASQSGFTPSPGWPVAGLPASSVIPLGSAPASAPGEVWGIGNVKRVAGPDGAPVQDAAGLVRQRGDGGWEFVSRVAGTDGKPAAAWPPVRGVGPGRVTERGGVVYAVSDGRIVARNPGGAPTVLTPPDATVLPSGLSMAESSRVTLAAFDGNDKVHVLVAPVGRVEDRVLYHDGAAWTSEMIDLPTGAADFKVGAIAVEPSGQAWLTATAKDGLLLYRRDTSTPGSVTWERVTLTDAKPFVTSAATRPLAFPAEGLTAIAGALWIDARLETSGPSLPVTMRFDTTARRVTRTWCDDAVCDANLGVGLGVPSAPDDEGRVDNTQGGARAGYRSFAWDGAGSGTRVITNPRFAAEPSAPAGAGYAVFDGATFRAVRAGGPRASGVLGDGAFTDARTGWLGQSAFALTRIAPGQLEQRLQAYPLPIARPLLAVVPEPGRSPGDPTAGALAVGDDGRVVRYVPGQGWLSEQLTAGATRATPRLNAVAWPEPSRAYAAGQEGEIWQWRAETGLWERDENAPLDLVGDQYTGLAFEPGNPDRGYAITQAGKIFAYGKSWEPQEVPALKRGSTDQRDELRGIAFAGSEALVAAGSRLLVNRGDGWRVDEQVSTLLREQAVNIAELNAVAGLPDGGAVAAGQNVVIVRDRAGAPWRLADHQLAGDKGVVTAVAATRSGDRVRAVALVTSELDELPFPPVSGTQEPGRPPLIFGSRNPVAFASVFRETESGWIDDERISYVAGSDGGFSDCPSVPDTAHALALDAAGEGWIVGGETGQGSDARCSFVDSTRGTTEDRNIYDTAAVWRYGAAPAPPPAIARQQPALSAGPARLLVGGHAACRGACAESTVPGLAPDRYLAAALDVAAQLHAAAGGPRALLYTGTRVAPSVAGDAAEQSRFAALLGTAAGRIPLFLAPAKTDAGTDATAFSSSFAGLPAPQGQGAMPGPVRTTGVLGGEPAGGARTHYAFDTTGPEGALRIVVVDNSAGSLAASDAHQIPAVGAGGQREWLIATLGQAKAQGIPVVVMGSRPLTQVGATGEDGPAADGADVAQVLLDHGASAYVFDSPEQNVRTRIPQGAPGAIPAFGSGSLGYTVASSESGFALLEVDLARRDPATNRAPVSARLVPVIEDLALDARDGREIRRSSPALFVGLGRRARAGNPGPARVLQRSYAAIPNEECQRTGCPASIDVDYTFTSSNPEVGDFVRADPARPSNPRAVFLDDTNKPVADGRSGLFCAFNPGETRVQVNAGGLSYTTTIKVLAGSPRQPCGTRPVTERQVESAAPGQPPAAPPGLAPQTDANPGGLVAPPPAAIAVPAAIATPAPPALASPPPGGCPPDPSAAPRAAPADCAAGHPDRPDSAPAGRQRRAAVPAGWGDRSRLRGETRGGGSLRAVVGRRQIRAGRIEPLPDRGRRRCAAHRGRRRRVFDCPPPAPSQPPHDRPATGLMADCGQLSASPVLHQTFSERLRNDHAGTFPRP
ncbi:hypothetical protein LRS13_23075 [Svornostia abyssi]|uniref:Uncharacterized protein n=1 Tax=Svornostia abyssi TaxID=2898438 RepID=A0ABY5PGH4_9ACTN|nr:hypothetical protein LRS13_23075 [Parviterribacteraceae bacterium J379]